MKTKLLLSIAFVGLIILCSCNSNKANNDCDKFLTQYEDYMNKYIELIKKAQSDPTNASLIGEAAKLQQEAAKLQNTPPEICKNDPMFLSKFATLQAKMTSNAMR